MFCKNLILNGGKKCKAFPDGIPEDILTGVLDHTKEYPGDHGIQFEENK
jgi:hypothetical protein